MRLLVFGAVFLAMALFAASGAQATTWLVSCTNGTVSNGTTVTNSATPLGSLLGMPGTPATISPAPVPGDTIKVGGTCAEDVTITTPQLLLINSSSNPEAVNGDGVQGQLEVARVTGITLLGLTLGSTSSTVTFASPSDQAQLYVHDGAGITVQYSVVENSSLFGILAAQSSTVSVLNSTVTTNGNGSNPQSTAGIRAINGSTVILAAPDQSPGASPTEVNSSHGDGVSLLNGSTLVAQDDTTIGSNNQGRQILIASGSSAHITGGSVDGFSCFTCLDTIDLVGGSLLRLDGGVQVLATAGDFAILASDGSGIITSGSTIAASTTAADVPIVDATDNSVIILAGGNTICSNSCDSSATGTAIQVDHVSTLTELPSAEFGYPAGAEAIFGDGIAQLQSTIDLGIGLVSSAPGLAWATSPNGISVAQNSSFRLEGGVAITGTVILAQGSNGFFNASAGGTNTVSGGVSCPFNFIPASHVTASSAVLSPAPTLASNFFSVAPNQCMKF
jgi:hypothetical protein